MTQLPSSQAAPQPPPPVNDSNENSNHDDTSSSTTAKSKVMESLKLFASVCFLLSSVYTTYTHQQQRQYQRDQRQGQQQYNDSLTRGETTTETDSRRRRLSFLDENNNHTPSYMTALMDELKERKKLFEDTPPEEVKYWFEYTGPLQKYFYRYSKSRGKADYFEGRDDSGVISSRFHQPGGGPDFASFFATPETDTLPLHHRMVENCFALGSDIRPDLSTGGNWFRWFKASSSSASSSDKVTDRCRVLITLNTAGAGRGSTILWETQPPPIHTSHPRPWMSEQSSAAIHLERNLKEVDAMCATGMIAVRLQVLVCEPIPGVWTEYMDSMLPNCGGSVGPLMEASGAGGAGVGGNGGGGGSNGNGSPYENDTTDVEERPSPVQVVVVAGSSTADTCHDLKSGFMEKRVQDLILAPPYLDANYDSSSKSKFDPAVKTTHADLVSSDDYDLYVGLKWSSLVTIRSISSFLQASADISAAAASPRNQEAVLTDEGNGSGSGSGNGNGDGATVAVNNQPSSPFLIPSFVRVSYVSEENNKVAKWRMHGDFFHPAAWEVCKDSFDVTWIPDSLSGNGGVSGICYDQSHPSFQAVQRRLGLGDEKDNRNSSNNGENDCGQWWIYMAEEQMSLNPEVYANEVSAPIVQGGGNQFWMLTEKHRQEVLKVKVCEHNAENDKALDKCGQNPQAVIPLGDMESFLINFTPNTALGKKHTLGRRPGYSKEDERERDRDLVRERKQLKGQEDIEKALFDYTVYPVALFRKDATLKAARARDAILTKTKDKDEESLDPKTVKSSYYDVTIKKPREATLGWCQSIARKGLCSLYGEYFRESTDKRCMEACGLKKNWTVI